MMPTGLSAYDLDQPLSASLERRTIQGIRSQLDRFYISDRTPALRDIATRKVSVDLTPFISRPNASQTNSPTRWTLSAATASPSARGCGRAM